MDNPQFIGPKQKSPTRYWEIDAIRGLAIVSMVGFHAAFVDRFFFGVNLCPYRFFWRYVPMFIGGTFLTVAGISLHIGAAKGRYPSLAAAARRSSFLFLGGMLLTLGTCILNFGGGIYFGILHCIGLSSFVGFLLLQRSKYTLLAIGTTVIIVGMHYLRLPLPCWHEGLFWLYPCQCLVLGPMFDYYPLTPWGGFLLVGVFLGKQFYPQDTATLVLPQALGNFLPVRLLSYLGRHSLLIYFAHLPVVYTVLSVVNYLLR